MKSIILTAILAGATAMVSTAAERQSVIIGSAAHDAPNGVVVGEALSGTIGSTDDLHVTVGQAQGITNVRDYSSVESIAPTRDDYSVYPNPAIDIITITRPDATVADLSLTALNGATVLAAELSAQCSSIDISSISPGVYILAIRDHEGHTLYTVKIIKL